MFNTIAYLVSILLDGGSNGLVIIFQLVSWLVPELYTSCIFLVLCVVRSYSYLLLKVLVLALACVRPFNEIQLTVKHNPCALVICLI
jgi:hypothetical protein